MSPPLPEPDWPLSDGIVTLRRFRPDDVPDVTRACQDPEIPRWTATVPTPYTEEHARWWIDQQDGLWSSGTTASFAFCSAETDELLGSMTLHDIPLDRQSAVAGYWAVPWARNRGATTRALRLACEWGFDAVALQAVTLTTMLGNTASERVADKAGFRLVGTSDDHRPARARDPEAAYRVKRWVLERAVPAR